jgi:hypothetical protein
MNSIKSILFELLSSQVNGLYLGKLWLMQVMSDNCKTSESSFWQLIGNICNIYWERLSLLISHLSFTIDWSSLDGIDRSDKHPLLMVNKGGGWTFHEVVAFVLTTRNSDLVQVINTESPVQRHVESPGLCQGFLLSIPWQTFSRKTI